jgi:hypothetical protein
MPFVSVADYEDYLTFIVCPYVNIVQGVSTYCNFYIKTLLLISNYKLAIPVC